MPFALDSGWIADLVTLIVFVAIVAPIVFGFVTFFLIGDSRRPTRR